MTTYQDNPPQTFSLTIPNNSIENVLGYYVKVTDTGTTIIHRKYKKDDVIRDAFIGEIPKKGNYKPTIVSSTEETQYFSGTLNATNLIRNQAVPVVNRGIDGNAGGGISKINTILGTNLAPSPPPGPGATESGQNPDPNFNLSTIQTGGVVGSATPNEKFEKILKYPLHESKGYDYLKINILEYVPSGIPQLSDANLGTLDVEQRKTSILGTIFLPMQPGISDSASSSWNEDNLNPVQAAIGGLAGNIINAGGAIDIKRGLEELQRAAGGAQSIIQNNPILGQFIDNYFAQQIVGSNLFARSTGAVINPNLELLFNGPKMRTFNYNYRFTPRDDKEAKVVRSIIKALKKNSLPKKDPNGLFLKTPNVFKLKYVFGKNGKEEEHPYLNKIKVCALTDMNVNYTPDGSYSTYNDGSMTSYTVSLSFSELNPIYYDDFDDNSIDTPTTGY